jgi:glutamine amidotransferase
MLSIIDYGVSNVRSVVNALRAVDVQVELVTTAAEVRSAKKLLLPGVGSFGAAVSRLRDTGTFLAIRDAVLNGTPVLGICLGMQLLFEASEECPGERGLGLLDGVAQPFGSGRHRSSLLTHMGFSSVRSSSNSRLFAGIPSEYDFYFVHSFHLQESNADLVATSTFRHRSFVAAVEHGNQIFGTQFHPERSQGNGLMLLRNFSKL